jgi:hypothetical protein
MPFPLPLDPDYRRIIVSFWIDDVDDRLAVYRWQDAEKSWKYANDIYLSLPPGEGSEQLESALMRSRVKINNISQKL